MATPNKRDDQISVKFPKSLEGADGVNNFKLARDNGNWGAWYLGIDSLWRQSEGEGIRVAVLDTGADLDHVDLKDAIVLAKDFTNEGTAEDTNGHGTHCAGVIGARKNDIGFVGIAPKCDLLIGRIFNSNESTTEAWIVDAIDWAVAEKADIISMSFGGPFPSADIFNSVHRALAAGVMMIAAGGNDGSRFENSVGFPGRYGSVITVGAHDHNGNPAGFSSRGGEIDLMGPGVDIWSTHLNNGYASLSGTSMATPFIAGISALACASYKANHNPIPNNEVLKGELVARCTHPGYHDNRAGYGPLSSFKLFF